MRGQEADCGDHLHLAARVDLIIGTLDVVVLGLPERPGPSLLAPGMLVWFQIEWELGLLYLSTFKSPYM